MMPADALREYRVMCGRVAVLNRIRPRDASEAAFLSHVRRRTFAKLNRARAAALRGCA